MRIKHRIPIAILFIAYLIVLMKLLIFKYPSAIMFEIVNGNYVPFKTIFSYIGGEPTWDIAIRNLGGNVLLFAPLGFFVPLLRRSSAWKSVLIAALIISTALEIIQGIFKVGVFDVDDILLNIFGAIIGFGIYVCLKLVFAKK
ncbi:MAG: VanZ family protein [Patescibacteria group bacterium]